MPRDHRREARKRLTGLALADYDLKAIAFVDDIALAVSSEEDVAIFRRAFELHSAASNTHLTEDKTEILPIENPT
ncbi:hypothetical protein EV175_005449, partial [Coemansia sp. RSA 1933]